LRNQNGTNRGKIGHHPQPESTKEKPQAQQPPIIVNIEPSPKTQAERAEEAEDRRKKAETDAKLADYTGELAFFTKGLFIATVILGIATIGLLVAAFFQSRDMKASIAAAQKSANVAERALVHSKSADRPNEVTYGMVRGEQIIAYRITVVLEKYGDSHRQTVHWYM
jgi:hypothetical protein